MVSDSPENSFTLEPTDAPDFFLERSEERPHIPVGKGTDIPLPQSDPRKITTTSHNPLYEEPFQLPGFPTSEEAQKARDYGIAYGKAFEQYTQGNIYKSGKEIRGNLNRIENELKNTPVSDVPEILKKSVANYYTKAALVANKSAISALGFNPAEAVTEWSNTKSTVAGFFTPSTGFIWNSANYPDSLSHESSHKGLKKLLDSGMLTDKEKDFVKANNELIVRYLMQEHAGQEVPSPKDKNDLTERLMTSDNLERSADYIFRKSPFASYYLKMLKDIEAKAAKLVQKNHPRGPN